jgi:hypothetical protein
LMGLVAVGIRQSIAKMGGKAGSMDLRGISTCQHEL